MPRRRWEHDGEDMSTAPKRPDGGRDWTRIKHRHTFVFDGASVGGYPIGVGGMHCNRDCGERREGPVCAGWSIDRWGSRRYHNAGKVVDEKCPWGSPNDPRCPPSVEQEGVTGWWYCGVHDPERKRQRDRAWRIKFDRGTALRDQRYAEDSAARMVVAEVIDWEKLESEVEPICETACEHHTCRLVRATRAYVALIAQGDSLRSSDND